MFNYKSMKPEKERIEESRKIIEKYPDKIPIIVEKSKKSKIKNIDKNKFLVPSDMTLSQFIYVVRKRIKISSTEALFFFVNDRLCNNSALLSPTYTTYKDNYGFLYITYSSENTFG